MLDFQADRFRPSQTLSLRGCCRHIPAGGKAGKEEHSRISLQKTEKRQKVCGENCKSLEHRFLSAVIPAKHRLYREKCFHRGDGF